MIIETFTVQNYMGFAAQEFTLHKQFNLFAGVNGSGKTSLLEALADSLGLWHSVARHYGTRNIRKARVRRDWVGSNGASSLEPQYPCAIKATGSIAEVPVAWERGLYDEIKAAWPTQTSATRKTIQNLIASARNGEPVVLPLIAYYGDARLHLDRQVRASRGGKEDPRHLKNSLSRLEGLRNSLDSRIAWKDWVQWVAKQEWRTFQDRTEPPEYALFKTAVLSCLEGGESFGYDARSEEILVGIAGHGVLPLADLSAGQKIMVMMVGDLARRMALLNPHLGPDCLMKTPGIVLIDELDLHLHPIWQRTIPHSLKNTFPSVQFVCTSHSPQIIGELPAAEVHLLKDGTVVHPGQSFGMDSNWILEVLMGGADMNQEVVADLERVQDFLMEKKITEAASLVTALRSRVGNSGAIQGAASSVERFKILGR